METATKLHSIWDLDDATYKNIIETEISSLSDNEDWIADELALCFAFDDTANPDRGYLYWARRHWYLVDKRGLVVLFRPKPLQWQYLLTRTNENVELKARKMGQSTVIDSLYYWRARRREHQHMFILAHTAEAAAELWGRVQFAHSQLQEKRPFLYGPTKKLNRRELEWTDNHSKLRIATAGGKGIGRASDADGMHLSEAAHYDDLKGVLAALGEAKREDAWIDIESTPNGYDAFRDEYVKARSKDGRRKAHFYPWFNDPTYMILNGGDDIEFTDEEARLARLHNLTKDQIAWRRAKIKDLDVLFKQEHPEDDDTCFLLGGTPLFDNLVLREIYKDVEQNERPLSSSEISGGPFEGGPDGNLLVWEIPKDDCQYVVGADIAEGIVGLAYSVGCVVKILKPSKDDPEDQVRCCEQVAEWRGHINPFSFGTQILAPIGNWYNRALIAPERNNHGHASIAGLKECVYPRIYKHRSNMHTRWGKGQSPKFGFPNSSETRPQLLAGLRRTLSNGDFRVRSLRLLQECMSMQAEEAHFDADRPTTEFRDCVFAAGIAIFVRKRSLPVIV